MDSKTPIAILISGRGSNMVSIAEAARAPDYPAEVKLVIANIPGAGGLEKAQKMGIEALTIDHKRYKSRRSFEKALHRALLKADIEWICCAGFMRVLTPWFVDKWQGRILNIHPSLLPKYKGLNTHQRALDAGDEIHGCSVHFVDAELDNGAIILQETIKIEKNDTPETLASRLLPIENRLYPAALKLAINQGS